MLYIFQYQFLPPLDRAAYSHVMADRILLGAAVVAAAGLIVGGESMCAVLVATFCHHIARISKQDILTLASCIVRATDVELDPLDLLPTLPTPSIPFVVVS